MNTLEGAKTVHVSIVLDEETNETFDRLCRAMAESNGAPVSHSLVARMAIRRLALAWGIETQLVGLRRAEGGE